MVKLPGTNTPTLDAIYAAYEAEQGTGFREHLGASLIGKDCSRALWYDFRWATPSRFEGRLLRLFETGQLEEERLVRNLRAAGATVVEVDPQTGRQYTVSALGGHFGGSLDGVALGLAEAPKTWHVLEFKTHSAKSFADLSAKGVALSKPQHEAQMQIYMHLMGLTRARYIAVCKNTDALYIERIKADSAAATRLLEKAGRIIFAQRPPERLSSDPSWFICKFCNHHKVCHQQEAAAKTCRSCLHATPRPDGPWHCARFDEALSPDKQRSACAKHLFIPDLVPGKVSDAGQDYVAYTMAGGQTWVNDARTQEGASC